MFVTRNRDDFIAITLHRFEAGLPHFGLLIVPHSLPGDRFNLVARALGQYANDHPAGMAAYTVTF